jgi:CDP-diacylglycerol--serine O-phosphatidyltransferase
MRTLTEQLPRRGWIPAAFTAANIAVGFTATLLASNGRYETAVYLLVLAIFLDMMDGRLARRLRVTSLFGKQLDSFCDVLSFGAAPAFLVYQAILRPLGVLGVAVALVYLLAAVYRLARFNLFSDEHEKARRTCGLPVPIGAGYLMAATLMRDQIDPLVSVAVVLIMAVLMASRLRLPDLKGAGLVSAMLVVGIFNYLALVVWPNWYTVGWWNLWNALILLAARSEDRRAGVETASSES